VQLLERRYRGELDDEADRFIGFTVAGVERMQALIDDLLSYSRVGTGELRGDRVDSHELVKGTLASLDASVREAEGEDRAR
jgi:light-regulated signal transduction histidine kinase (bacteriophytochrome)